MTVVGDEAEKTVARHLARLGFDLVYQSRASRGAAIDNLLAWVDQGAVAGSDS